MSKLLLTDDEIRKVLNTKGVKGAKEYISRLDLHPQDGINIARIGAKAQLSKARKTLLSPEEVEEKVRGAYRDVGEGLCNLIGNTMLEDMEVGKKLADQLDGTLKYCQHQAGIVFEALQKEGEG